MHRRFRCRALYLLSGFVCGLGSAQTSPDYAASIREDWDWQARIGEVRINPSGEIQGAPTWADAAGGVDGERTGSYGFHTTNSKNPWWQVDLGESVRIGRIVVYNRNEDGLEQRASGMLILVSQDGRAWQEVFRHTGEAFGGIRDGKPLTVDFGEKPVEGRFVRCALEKQGSFHLDEIEVYPAGEPDRNVALNRPADQSSAGRSSRYHDDAPVAGDRRWPLEGIARALDRQERLLSALARLDGDRRAGLAAELGAARKDLDALSAATVSPLARRDLYYRVMDVGRRLALTNPLLDFDSLVFVKRRPGALAHMCDQFFGSLARPGGSLCVLENLRGKPVVRDIIGDRLPLGTYLSPDLSWDGRRIVFAYAKGDAARKPVWNGSPDLAYHIFSVNLDGTDLRQITEGRFDDIHPRWLPDGDIVFISTRRGGETRCSGRPVPTYTLHRMTADGSQITRLSAHETHEWHPAILPDGSLLYTRWDYVDRHTNISHSLWSCRPDGTAPMAVYGNYNHERKPWGLWSAQPVPGSQKILAIAGAHHGYAAGSLVMIDPLLDFDGGDPVERLSPEIAFPEAEGYPYSAFDTPWPLSEDFYLVAYSPAWSTHSAEHQVTTGIYLADRFGNRILLYRDPLWPSQGAIPVRPRVRPEVYPFDAETGAKTGRFLLANVRASGQAFPDVPIKGLRVVQILPKTTYAADQPKVSVARQISARVVVGEVPVEEDGSAYFEAPAGVPVYFQALDENRMAVQTMRSITYLQPGEVRSCVGCHEPRQSAVAVQRPRAAVREASVPVPGPEGTRPFSYMRLVQPVLDRHCTRCHRPEGKAAKLPLTGGFASQKAAFTRSYETLARKSLVPWFDSVNGGEWIPQSTPGRLGARASKLIGMLREGHEGVKLPADDLYRLSLWVDLNVPFYGSYEPEHVAAQRAGHDPPLEDMLQ